MVDVYFASVLSIVTIQNACLSERGVFFRGSHPTNIMFHFEKSGIICSLSEKKKIYIAVSTCDKCRTLSNVGSCDGYYFLLCSLCHYSLRLWSTLLEFEQTEGHCMKEVGFMRFEFQISEDMMLYYMWWKKPEVLKWFYFLNQAWY